MARKLEVAIVGDASSVKRAFGDASGAAGGFSKGLGRVAKMGVLAAGAAGIGALAVTLKAGISEFAEHARVAAQTGAVLKSTGGVANVTAKEISALSESLMRKSGVDDEAIQSGENMLLTFTKIRNEVGAGNDIFNQATKATLNMSVAMGKDMPAAAILVGKALNDPVKGVSALTKAGIQFTAAQKEQITAMVETGNVMGAQKLILKELETQFGGSADAAGKTLPGQLSILKESFNNLAGSVVSSLVPALKSFMDFVTANWSTIESVMRSVFQGIADAFRVGVDVANWLIDQWRTHQETISRIWNTVKDVVGTSLRAVAAFAEAAWPRVLEAAQRVVAWYQGTLAPAIQNVISALRAIWERFGEDITRIAATAFNAVATIVRAAMNIIKSVIELALALIRGDWSEAWTALKSIASNALTIVATVIRGALSIIWAAAKALGAAIVDGILALLPTLPGKIVQALNAINAALAAAASAAFAAAVQIGQQIISGIISGLAGLVGRVSATIAGGVRSAIDFAKNNIGSTAEEAASKELGQPLGQGVISGFLLGSASLPEKVADKIRDALERAKAVIQAGRSDLASAFSDLASAGSEALDKLFGGQTASERKLEAMETARQVKEIVERIKEARAALAVARGGEMQGDVIIVDHEAVKAAEKALADALYEQTRFNLERQAEIERAKRDEQLALRKRHFEERLTALQASLEREGATQQEAHNRVMALFKSFGIDYRKSGHALGAALAEGILDSMSAVEQAAAEIARVIAKYLKTRSPAELGPLSTLDTWAKGFVDTYAKGFDVGGMQGTLAAAVAPVGAGGGGGTHIHLHGGTYIGTNMRQAAEELRAEFVRIQGRQTSLGFR